MGYGEKPKDHTRSQKHRSYEHGQGEGGPGTWEKRTTPKKGADYQKKVTGAPDNTEYVVKTKKMKSGEKKFDGYDPEANTLIDAKDWDKWPPKGDSDWAKKRRDEMVASAKRDLEIAKEVKSDLEWHVPTQEKADELITIFEDAGLEIKVTVTHK